MYSPEKKDNYKRKIEKTVTRRHKEQVVAGEILALDPNHKPRGGYKKLMLEMINDYEYENE